MKRKRYTEEQIISILKEHEAGASMADLSRRHGEAETPCTAGSRSSAARKWLVAISRTSTRSVNTVPAG